MKASERVIINDDLDLIVVDGIRMTMPAIEALLLTPTAPDVWFRVKRVDKESGVIEIEQKHEAAGVVLAD